jgi:tripartite-type tricarboxylate transporter receptor subunit TctC
MPGIPTVAESGLPGYEVDIWYAIFVPAKTPAPVVAQLNGDLKQILAAPGMKEDLAQKGFTASYSTPEALAEVVRKDLARWKTVTDRIDLKDLN